MKKTNTLSLVFLLSVIILMFGCAVIPTCPGELLPIIEIQIDDTPSNHDDYISTSLFTPCRVRVTNFEDFNGNPNFPGGVDIEIRNRRLSTNLIVSPTNSGGSSSFFTTLPATGAWFNFFIRGNSTSSVDKSVILEMATAGATCNEVVISRKGLQTIIGNPPIPPALPQVEITIGSISHLDDYIGWSPVQGTLRWLNPPNAIATLDVNLRNMPGTSRLRFANAQPTSGTTATDPNITLTLPGDNTTVPFYVAGNFSSPSIDDKDAVIEIIDASSSNLISREGLMVRIRKNINTLSQEERNRYLETLRDVHLNPAFNYYMTFVNSHSQTGAGFQTVAHRQAHRGSAFLPWHRAFILHLERIMHSNDPSVSLPYWHFDQNSQYMFSEYFLGSNHPISTTNTAFLDYSNPIAAWQIPGEALGIRRRTPYGNSGTPGSVTGTTTPVFTELATLSLGNSYNSFKSMEGTTHNGAHNNSGNTISWLAGNPAFAPRDPVFFSLHCNVDRLWAKWQWQEIRFDPTQPNTYDLQQSHDNPPVGQLPNVGVNRTLGQYLQDSMWPWDNVNGGSGTAARPAISNLTPFPIVLGGVLPFAQPTVQSMIDFRAINFDYDDVYPY